MGNDCGCGRRGHRTGSRADVDNSAWDGPAAMSRCASSDTPASCYRAICAGRKAGDPTMQASWALPHHKTAGGPPNAAGVRNSLSRLPQTQGLTNAAEARRHLEAHLASINAGSNAKQADPDQTVERAPRDNLFRALRPGVELRDDNGTGVMPTLFGHFAVFNEWTEIDSFFEGRFMERLDPSVMDRTFTEDRDGMRVLFQHGRDPQIGDKPLGPIDKLEAQRSKGAYYEVPLIDTSYNRDLLLPGLRASLYGASFRFQVHEDHWNKKPGTSRHNPEGLPERTILDMTVREFGPVTFPAYAKATAGVRSVTDQFLDDHWQTIRELVLGGYDPLRVAELVAHHDLTGRPDARSAGGGDPGPTGPTGDQPGNGQTPPVPAAVRARDRALRMEGIIRG